MRLSIGKKLALSTIMFSLAAIAPLALLAWQSIEAARDSFVKERLSQLTSLREQKRAHLASYFRERAGDMNALIATVEAFQEKAFAKLQTAQAEKKAKLEGLLAQMSRDARLLAMSQDVYQAFMMVRTYKDGYDDEKEDLLNYIDVSTKAYGKIHRQVAPYFRDFAKSRGYSNFYVLEADLGVVFLARADRKDFGKSLKDPEYKDSGLARAYAKVVKTHHTVFEDFSAFAPRGGKATAFVASPFYDAFKRFKGVVVLEVPGRAVAGLAANSQGMGQSAKSYLAAREQGKITLRSPLSLGRESLEMGADISQTAPDYLLKALAGESGLTIAGDSQGRVILAAYTPLEFSGHNWAMVSQVSLAEAVAPRSLAGGKDYFARFVAERGYGDLLLLDKSGRVFYSVARRADLGKRLLGPGSSGGHLSRAVQKAVKSGKLVFSDYAPYAPNQGKPTAFLVRPVLRRGKVELAVALDLPLREINQAMQLRAGMGKSGESYLVGPDRLMRSNSYLDPQGHGVAASFANPNRGAVRTRAAEEALAGKSGAEIIDDYRGVPVLSSFAPVEALGRRWAILSEIDLDEVVGGSATAQELLSKVLWIGGASLFVVLLVVAFNAAVARRLSSQLSGMVGKLGMGSQKIAAAASQVSGASASLSEDSARLAASLQESSASLEQMASMTRQNSDNALAASRLMETTNQVVREADASFRGLEKAIEGIAGASGETGRIIKTIDSIAFQTNILALNAAVEAARAGAAGAGFAVVADEVRNLAAKTAAAARETAELIEENLARIESGGEKLCQVSQALGQVGESARRAAVLVSEIASASQEQAQGVEEISRAGLEMDRVTQEVATVAGESAPAAEDLACQSVELERMIRTLSGVVYGGGEPENDDLTERVELAPRPVNPLLPPASQEQ